MKYLINIIYYLIFPTEFIGDTELKKHMRDDQSWWEKIEELEILQHGPFTEYCRTHTIGSPGVL